MKSILSNILLILLLALSMPAFANNYTTVYKKNSDTHNAAYKQLVVCKEYLKEAEQKLQAKETANLQFKTLNHIQIQTATAQAKQLFIETSQDIKNSYSSNTQKDISPIIDRYQKAIKILEQTQINLNKIDQNSSQQTIKRIYLESSLQIEKACNQVNLAKAKLYIFQKSITVVSSKN